MRIAVCDAGLGNLRSVERAILRAAADGKRAVEVEITHEADRVGLADKVVVPGQGAFGDCARTMGLGTDPGKRNRSMGAAVREQIARGTPYLGICLGLQVLFEGSDEAPGCSGLAMFHGSVGRLAGGVDPLTETPLKIPHMGWNVVDPTDHPGLLPREPTHFYFLHSFVGRPLEPGVVAGTTEYGERFASAVARDNVFACQFHPEKSQRAGLALLERFLRL